MNIIKPTAPAIPCLEEIFASNVFTDAEMKKRLPEEIYLRLREIMAEGGVLPPEIAEAVAREMKNWAVSKGATHYTHWFQPLTGVTAEKHEAFLNFDASGNAVMEFSGRALVQGESDASSFPSGGLRATFEARGYTTWDYTSPAFLKEDVSGVTLCIPTSFRSAGGEALDEKTPLLRSMTALEREALRLTHLFGMEENSVTINTGAEQEYFLVDQQHFNRRMDMVFTGRTLFGARPPKSQEMEGHYYGAINERISSYMKELDIELWKMGVSAKTKHNEAAPAQHELVPVFSSANIAADHNQLIMETMQKVAGRHGLSCLLHEKPFSYINGSGKHLNWSISTASGINLLGPSGGNKGMCFVALLCAIIKAVDTHADLVRFASACAGNDHRLGSNEAPPAIISIFLGEHILSCLEELENGESLKRTAEKIASPSASPIPNVVSDNTDRNRTSPLAYTGNRFEFRMLPSSVSISSAAAIINTIVAEAISEITAEAEKANDPVSAVENLLRGIIREHKRIIFNGNGYSEWWRVEAARRGLPDLKTTADALPAIKTDKAAGLFTRFGVFSQAELESRFEVKTEEYIKAVYLEASTMLEMAERQILPAALRYEGFLARDASAVQTFLKTEGDFSVHTSAIVKINRLISETRNAFESLRTRMEAGRDIASAYDRAVLYKDSLIPAMAVLRACCDSLERLIPADVWPFPTYIELLFNI